MGPYGSGEQGCSVEQELLACFCLIHSSYDDLHDHTLQIMIKCHGVNNSYTIYSAQNVWSRDNLE